MTKDSIPKSKIPEALDALRALGAKELDDIPAREAIRKMRRQIERVLRLGYSYEEVSETLAGLDINISAERIRYLLSDIKRSTRKKSVAENLQDNTDTQVVNEQNLGENSATENSSSQSVKKSSAKSQAKSKSAKSVSTNSQTNTNTKNLAEAESNGYQNTYRPAFIPQIISDEDL
ncbi:hypothetical protein I8752_35945 [Nostocaceae cyanobacterium CENA369]|uniref:Uncharacterized protein n=1 Tax=Dendronalium phyllosphericum CENA369 TaxID=1725256 RepID=A0A8J7LIN1_9NOST|nr:hypothetical protein [Dendronalium phyllosphericum]MBH8578246.1 hypothetical protein [Dendronalium phyllosphericum CENA369]